MIKDKEASLFLVLDHTGHRVRRLTRAAGRLTVPPPPGPSLGTWSVSKGFRLLPPTKWFTFWVGTPHRAILPWARYCRIDPLGLNQNARWTDLLLATSLTGQLRKGQFSSHRSTDRCILNIHRSHRDHSPVTPGPGNTGTGQTGTQYAVTPSILGTPGQTRRNRHTRSTGHTGCTGHNRVHRSHRTILPWARYCRIDPLGLNQNARWTDLLLVTGLTGQLRKGQFSSHRSANQCFLNIHRSHRAPVIPVSVRSVPGTGTQ